MTMDLSVSSPPNRAGKALRIGLCIAQAAAAFVFCFAGFTKLTTPIPQLSAMMPWAGAFPEPFVRLIGSIDIAGGLGLILPSMTRILPRLTVLAAFCCAVLQVLAATLHVARGELAVLPMNGALLILSIFILWGREMRAPISPRG